MTQGEQPFGLAGKSHENIGVEAEEVVLLDAYHRPSGTMLKSEVHGVDTPLHLAFSVYVFDTEGRFLVTRRALTKLTWAGVWTNSCCGHPVPGEDLKDAARRRLRQELGLEVQSINLAVANFSYRAVSPEGLVENEVCPVFTASVDRDPVPDPREVEQWEWVQWEAFTQATAQAPWAFSPWAVQQTMTLPRTVDMPEVHKRLDNS
jgi:isopentenyl-diphosphate delta-isomerase